MFAKVKMYSSPCAKALAQERSFLSAVTLQRCQSLPKNIAKLKIIVCLSGFIFLSGAAGTSAQISQSLADMEAAQNSNLTNVFTRCTAFYVAVIDWADQNYKNITSIGEFYERIEVNYEALLLVSAQESGRTIEQEAELAERNVRLAADSYLDRFNRVNMLRDDPVVFSDYNYCDNVWSALQ